MADILRILAFPSQAHHRYFVSRWAPPTTWAWRSPAHEPETGPSYLAVACCSSTKERDENSHHSWTDFSVLTHGCLLSYSWIKAKLWHISRQWPQSSRLLRSLKLGRAEFKPLVLKRRKTEACKGEESLTFTLFEMAKLGLKCNSEWSRIFLSCATAKSWTQARDWTELNCSDYLENRYWFLSQETLNKELWRYCYTSPVKLFTPGTKASQNCQAVTLADSDGAHQCPVWLMKDI